MTLSVLDSTMRDGAQHNKISYSVDDKLGIAEALYSLGIDYIEYGAPAFDDECAEFERRTKIPSSVLVAFGMTARKGIAPAIVCSCYTPNNGCLCSPFGSFP